MVSSQLQSLAAKFTEVTGSVPRRPLMFLFPGLLHHCIILRAYVPRLLDMVPHQCHDDLPYSPMHSSLPLLRSSFSPLTCLQDLSTSYRSSARRESSFQAKSWSMNFVMKNVFARLLAGRLSKCETASTTASSQLITVSTTGESHTVL